MSTPPLLRLRGVAKSFGTTRVLEGVDIEVATGEVITLVGENGSGKSTTSRIIAGVLQPDRGEVLVDGTVERLTPAHARSLGICYVGQEPALVPTLSVRTNLELGGVRWTRHGIRGSEVEKALHEAGFDGDPHRRVATLSAAEQAQVEIAKALLLGPRLLVLDEVTTRMPDPSALLDVVRRLSHQGVGTILITHRFQEIRSLADRAVVLRDGRIVGELTRAEITDARLSAMMVGREVSLLERQASARRDDIALRVTGLQLFPGTAPMDFQVHAGEIVGVGGLMGSGRSRLLETTAGVRPPHAGRVEIDGRTLRPGRVAAARAGGVGLVPEDRDRQGLVRQHTIRANIRLGAYAPLERPRAEVDRSVAARMCAALRIRAPHADVRVATLSGGNAQKVVFARELARDPRVLVLDEPTRGVDIGARADIYALIRDRAAAGAAVLVASSDLQELATLCDRVIVLLEGSMVGEVQGDHINDEEIVLLASGSARRTGPAAGVPTESTTEGTP